LAEAEVARLNDELVAERVVARKDTLTGLFNRSGFFEFGSAALTDSSRRPLVFILVEIEHFKRMNETLGTLAVDQIISALGRRLSDYTKGGVVGRIGDHTLAALVTSSIASDGTHYPHLRDLSRTLGEPVCVAGYLVRITTSVGMANVDEAMNLRQALQRAEVAMRRATRSQAILAGHHAAAGQDHQSIKGRVVLGPVYYRSRVVARHYRRA
ncbi:GGDEF domain-containing protein, partial [Allorhizocola rhizosphaerae]|uniref:GGDEF domain-containing protein n=1 Tax=Allorhizocola rhizosphaerae TaxID=1872709 RepID=UPI0013C344A1